MVATLKKKLGILTQQSKGQLQGNGMAAISKIWSQAKSYKLDGICQKSFFKRSENSECIVFFHL